MGKHRGSRIKCANGYRSCEIEIDDWYARKARERNEKREKEVAEMVEIDTA